MPTTTIIAANDACAVAPGDTYFITIIGLRVYQASINIVFITLSQVPSKQVVRHLERYLLPYLVGR